MDDDDDEEEHHTDIWLPEFVQLSIVFAQYNKSKLHAHTVILFHISFPESMGDTVQILNVWGS